MKLAIEVWETDGQSRRMTDLKREKEREREGRVRGWSKSFKEP